MGNYQTPSIVPSSTTGTTAAPSFEKVALEAGIKNDANWFYWIAALSAVNTVAALSGTNWRFLIGLGITQVVDSVASSLGGAGKVAAVIVDFFALGVFVLCGVFANKRQKWAFVLGMVLLGLDGCIELLAQDWLGLAFHGYAIYFLFRGFKRVGMWQALIPPDPSAPIG